jgi:capsid protein
MLIEAGLKSRDMVIRERGGKGVEHVDSQIASDRACDEAHGLDFSVVTKPTISKGEPGAPIDDEKPDPKKDSKAGLSRMLLGL